MFISKNYGVPVVMRRKMLGFVFAIFCSAAAAGGPIFRASFDQDFSATSGDERIEAKTSQELLWETLQNLLQPGISGNAAVIGTAGNDKEKKYHAVYENQGYLDGENGTVSFWLKPVNWSGDDHNFHIFFQAVGDNATMLIYKYLDSPVLMFLAGSSKPVDGKNAWSTAEVNIGKWNAGDWHHLAATFDATHLKLYLDGIEVASKARGTIPQTSFKRFAVGAVSPQSWKTPLDLTLIDELQIFKRALTPEEIAAEFQRYAIGRQTAAIKDIRTLAVPEKQRLDLCFTLEGGVVNCLVQIFDTAGKERFQVARHSLQPRWTVEIPFSVMPSGKYQIRITGLDPAGKSACTEEHPFQMPQFPEPWENNRLGLESGVPKPWMPLSFEAKENRILGIKSDYCFGDAFLPRQITANGEALLSRPMALKLDGKKIDPGKRPQAVEISPESIALQSEVAEAGFLLKTRIRSEYDGFTWVTVTLTPEKAARVNSLQLEIPFRPEQSTLFNSMNKFYYQYEPGHCGKFREYTMNLYRQPPIIFVGNDRCGLQWFCEELPSWHNQNQERTLELIPGKTENLLRLNLIDKPVMVNDALQYEFGFQCVPMRPMPSEWRAWCPYGNFDPYFVWSKFHHYPYVDAKRTDKEFLQNFANKTNRFGKKLFYYFAGFSITPTFPEWPYYSALWMLTPPEHGRYGCVGDPANYFVWICPRSAEYRDFYLDRLKTVIEELDIHNLYIDNQDAQMCDNPRHGCGYVGSDGKRYQSFNLRSTRELAMRLYKMFKDLRPDGLIMRHMSAKPEAPVIAFCDMLADGELYNRTVANDESYFNIFDPEMFRASFRGTLWGVPQFFIPQFTRAIPTHNPKRYHAWNTPEGLKMQEDKIRHFKGYFLIHDAQIFQLFGVRVDDWEKIKQRFGMSDAARFIGYFDAERPWESDPGVMVSAYVKNERLMLLVMNNCNSDRVDINLSKEKLSKFGITSTTLHNAETGQKIEMKSNGFSLPLKYRDYAILWNL